MQYAVVRQMRYPDAARCLLFKHVRHRDGIVYGKSCGLGYTAQTAGSSQVCTDDNQTHRPGCRMLVCVVSV